MWINSELRGKRQGLHDEGHGKGLLAQIFAVCLLLVAPAHGQESWPETPELVILDTSVIPMAPVTGTPLLVILRTYANDPGVPNDALSVDFQVSIEQDGRTLASAKPRTVQIPNGNVGEIRHQFKAGPAGRFHVHTRIARGSLGDERRVPLRIASDQAESDAITQRFLSVCSGLEGGFTALNPMTWEPYCACPPGMGVNAVGNRCEEMP
jgi:hypothetical protein